MVFARCRYSNYFGMLKVTMFPRAIASGIEIYEIHCVEFHRGQIGTPN